MARRPTTEPDDEDLAERVNQKYEAHIASLLDQLKGLVAEEIEFRESGSKPTEPSASRAASVESRTREFMNGFASTEAPLGGGERYWAIINIERPAVERAIANSRELQRQAAPALVAVALRGDERRKLQTLQEMRWCAEALVERELRLIASTKMAVEEGRGWLPHVAVPWSGAEVSSLLTEFLEACEAKGIVAAKPS